MQRETERSLLPPKHFLLPLSSSATRTAHTTVGYGRVDLQATTANVRKVTGAMAANTEEVFRTGTEYPANIDRPLGGYGKLESEGRRRTSLNGEKSYHENYGGNFESPKSSCARLGAGEANPSTHKVTQSNHVPSTLGNLELPVLCSEETFSAATPTSSLHSDEPRAVHRAPSQPYVLQATAQVRDAPERGGGGGGAGSDVFISLPNATSREEEERMLDAWLPKNRGTSKALAIEGKPFGVASNSEPIKPFSVASSSGSKHFSVSVVHDSSSGRKFVERRHSVVMCPTTATDGALPAATGPARGSGAKDLGNGGRFLDEEQLLEKSLESQMIKLDKSLQYYEPLRKKWASSPSPLTRGGPTERASLSSTRKSPRSILAPPTSNATSPALDPAPPTEVAPSSLQNSAFNTHEPTPQAPSFTPLPPPRPHLRMPVQRVMESEIHQLNNLDSVTPDTEKEILLPAALNHPPLPTSSSSTSSSSSREAELSEETFPVAVVTNDQTPCIQERSLKLGMAEDLRGRRAEEKEEGEEEEEEEEEENDLDNPIGTCVQQPLLRVEGNERKPFGVSVTNHQLDRFSIARQWSVMEKEEEEEQNDVDFLCPTEEKTINFTRSFGKPLLPPPYFPTAVAPTRTPPTPPHSHTVTPSHRHTLTPSLVAERSPETRNDTAIACILQTEEEMQAGVKLLRDVQGGNSRAAAVTARDLELARQIQDLEEGTKRGRGRRGRVGRGGGGGREGRGREGGGREGGGRGRGVLSQSNMHGGPLPFSGRGYVLGGKA